MKHYLIYVRTYEKYLLDKVFDDQWVAKRCDTLEQARDFIQEWAQNNYASILEDKETNFLSAFRWDEETQLWTKIYIVFDNVDN